MKQTKGTTEARPKAERSLEASSNVVSLNDYRKRKTPDSLKQEFRDSLDNDRVMQRYNIQQPTLEERTERIRQSIARINAMLREVNNQ